MAQPVSFSCAASCAARNDILRLGFLVQPVGTVQVAKFSEKTDGIFIGNFPSDFFGGLSFKKSTLIFFVGGCFKI